MTREKESMAFNASRGLKIPGLIQPYAEDRTNDTEQNRMNGKTNRLDPNKFDPYSIYDDDSTQDHYFLVPGDKLNLCRFRRTFVEMNKNKLFGEIKRHNNTEGSSSRTTSIKKNNNNNTQTLQNIQNNISRQRSILAEKRLQPESGDYCFISQDASLKKMKSLNRSCLSSNTTVNKEKFNKFASKYVTTNMADINETHIHSFDKKEPSKHLDGHVCRKKKRNYKIDKCIDICTCMVCVKAVRYHWTDGDTGSDTDPCSCTGKNLVGRWLCMGVLALFMPCLFCYLPARSCRKLCSDECSRTKLKSDAYQIRYTADISEEGTYL